MPQKMSTRAPGAIAMAVATSAVACAACCVLPLAFPAVMLAGFGSVTVLFAGAFAWAASLALVIVVGAWVWVGWQSLRSRARPAGATLYMMGGATALTVVAVMWRQIEPMLIRAILG